MAIEIIDLGTVPLDGSDGDVAREAFEKVNANFAEHESEIDAITPRVTDLENEVGQLEIQAGQIQGDLTNLTESFNIMSSEVGSNTTDIQNLENSREYTLVAGGGITIDRSTPTAPIISSTGSSGSVWGQITGDITDQIDLFELLEDKATIADLDFVANKVDRILASDAANNGAGAVPYDATYNYPAGSVGAAVKDGGGQSAEALREDLANPDDPSKGAAIVAYRSPIATAVARTVAEELGDRISVKTFGAIGDGIADDTAAIQKAIDYACALPGVSAFPYQTPRVWFPYGKYVTSRTLWATKPIELDGDGALISGIGEGFTSRPVPLAAGGTEQTRALVMFLDGLKNHTDGPVSWKAKIGQGITLNCNEYAYPAVYFERMCYPHINCEIQGSSQNGVEVGPQCWCPNFDNIILENITGSNILFLPFSAPNGMSINNPRIWGEFKESYAGINFSDGSAANGVHISGGMIEKVGYGVLVGVESGPIHIDGVDFEYNRFGCVRAVGSAAEGRQVGPVTVSNSFLHSLEGPKVYADRATVTVESCRMYPGSDDFQTMNGGSISAKNNQYQGGLEVVAGSSANIELSTSLSYDFRNYVPHKIADWVSAYNIRNYQYLDLPLTQTSGLSFNSYYVGGAPGLYVSESVWWVSEYQHITAPGNFSKRIGVKLANDSGQNAFQPVLDGLTSLGGPSARWTTVYAFTGTINTSDAREKQQVRQLSEKERAVANRLKSSIRAFKFNSSVEEKSQGARIHFGVIAQDVISAFESEGLDAFDYAMICHDKWDEQPDIVDDDGSVIRQYTPAGDRYGVRYEELLSFIVSVI